MGEKSTIQEALNESRRLVGDVAARAKQAAEPHLKTVREAADRLRESFHPPGVRRGTHTVDGRRGAYEVQEKERGAGLDGAYTVLRFTNGSTQTEVLGSFDVSATIMTLRCTDQALASEIALVASVWLENPAGNGSSSQGT